MEVGVRGNGEGLGVDMGEPLLMKKKKQNKLNKRDIFSLSKRMLKKMEEGQSHQDQGDKLGERMKF